MTNLTIVAPDATSASNSRFRIAESPDHAEIDKIRSTAPNSMSLGDVASGVLRNAIPSAISAAEGMVQPFQHPVKTGEALGALALGERDKLRSLLGQGPAPNESSQDAAQAKTVVDATNQYFSNRYGSIEGFKKAVATDPVGVAFDLSTLLTGGGSALERAPGLAGKIGSLVTKAGELANPVSAVGKAAKAAGPLAADFVGYLGTHTGAQALKLAAKAGAEGHEASQAFIGHLRGNAPIGDIVSSAKSAVAKMRSAKGAAYRAGMAPMSGDKTILDFNDIDKHVAKTNTVKNYKGQDLSPETADIRQKVTSAIEGWKKLSPAEFHTVEGMDALKQKIGSLRNSLPYGSPERLIADSAYHAIHETIVAQAPTYAKVMKDYEDASHELDEMQKTLSLNPKASVDTAARKLLSIMRNNVNTNFGRRAELGKILEQHGAKNLPFQLAGETLSPPLPTSGFGRLEASIPALASWASHNPRMLAALPFMSPRLMGEMAHGIGQVAGSPVMQHAPNAALILRAMGGASGAQDVSGQLGLGQNQ